MFELVNKKRSELAKGKKKGFTLIEVIVVLVILGILIAVLAPTMIGWIEKANKKAIVAEARLAQMSVQGVISENSDKTDLIDAGTGKLAAKYLADAGTLGEFDAAVKIPGGVTVQGGAATFEYVGGIYKVQVTKGVIGDPVKK